jgi:tripartite-type tricarboxylate transporter receptor subunit TctC
MATRAALRAIALLFFVTASAHAQTFPAKPVRVIVPLGPGSPPDVAARIVTSKMAELLGQHIMIDNRSGVGGTIGGLAAAKAPPDGYTLFMGSITSIAMGPVLFSKSGFEPLKVFTPVGLVSIAPSVVVVHPSLNVSTFEQFVALVKAHPGKFNYASPNNASLPHVSTELLLHGPALKMVHIPFGTSAKSALGLLNGDAVMFFEVLAAFGGNIQAGKLRALAVAAPKRLAQLPDVPTTAELGLPEVEAGTWSGLLAPMGTPPPIIQRLNAELNRSVAVPEVRQFFAKQFAEAQGGTPEQFGRFLAAETAKWSRAIALSGAKVE